MPNALQRLQDRVFVVNMRLTLLLVLRFLILSEGTQQSYRMLSVIVARGTEFIENAGFLFPQALMLAWERGVRSVSMPAVSSGIFGFSKDRCAKILVSESLEFLQKDLEYSFQAVEFCIFDEETLAHFRHEFDKIDVH